ncbi:Hypothetical_protein [Hexamita inflata]|uniref:Hypothetical_protein n=1 Tax=Hexamita inflata TaxID=28002 RepID=A0AA86S142_9EUKA|nr:Hypothetical protein HINF_LOCUS63865 [Hexamita inflata]
MSEENQQEIEEAQIKRSYFQNLRQVQLQKTQQQYQLRLKSFDKCKEGLQDHRLAQQRRIINSLQEEVKRLKELKVTAVTNIQPPVQNIPPVPEKKFECPFGDIFKLIQKRSEHFQKTRQKLKFTERELNFWFQIRHGDPRNYKLMIEQFGAPSKKLLYSLNRSQIQQGMMAQLSGLHELIDEQHIKYLEHITDYITKRKVIDQMTNKPNSGHEQKILLNFHIDVINELSQWKLEW